MNAIVQDAYGSPNVPKLEDINKPEPGDNEVLVRVVRGRGRARLVASDRGVNAEQWEIRAQKSAG